MSNERPESAVARGVGNGLRHIRRLRLITFFAPVGRCDSPVLTGVTGVEQRVRGLQALRRAGIIEQRVRRPCASAIASAHAASPGSRSVVATARLVERSREATTPTGSNRGGAPTRSPAACARALPPNGGGCALRDQPWEQARPGGLTASCLVCNPRGARGVEQCAWASGARPPGLGGE
jgi:hypothetical protein